MSTTTLPPYVDVSINDLAHFLFIGNTNDAIVEMSMPGIESTKDMFYFCLDLFCKGLVLLYGRGENHINIGDITADEFTVIQRKLHNAGINAKLCVVENINEETPCVDMTSIGMMPDNLDIGNYIFTVRTVTHVYTLTFALFHNI